MAEVFASGNGVGVRVNMARECRSEWFVDGLRIPRAVRLFGTGLGNVVG
jgi:hypothetical protein